MSERTYTEPEVRPAESRPAERRPEAAPPRRPAGPRDPLRARRTMGTWIRYNWPMLFLHLLLIVLGLLNLYPFFWMLGTSFKAEAEASNEKMYPFPGEKYKLAADFSLDRALPLTLSDGFEIGAEPIRRQDERKERLAEARARLNRMEAGYIEATAQQRLELGNEIDRLEQAVTAAATKLDRLKRTIETLHDLQSDAWIAKVDHRVDGVLNDLAGDPNDPNTRVRPVPGIDVAMQMLLDEGLVAEGDTGISLWPTEKLWRQDLPADLSEVTRAIAEDLRAYYTVTPQEYSERVEGKVDRARAELRALAGRGVLNELPGDEEFYRLSDGARGRIYEDLFPRQILTLWSMHDENIRRAESRTTYAKDRRAPEEYAKEAGLGGAGLGALAEDELEEMHERGILVSGRLQPINYWVVLKEENFTLHFMTSVLVTAFVVAGTVLIASMLGYALARLKFPGKMLVFGIMIAAAVLPGEARIIPVFKMLNAVGGTNNLWGMVLWLTSFGVGNALLMAGFFWTLPKEVDEAAAVDGAGVFRTYFDIAMPMAKPIVITIGVFAFLGAWNNFLVPLLCTISRPSMQPLAVAVYNFQQGHAGKWHQINAAASIMIVPVVLMFLIVQRHLVKAIAVGALKG